MKGFNIPSWMQSEGSNNENFNNFVNKNFALKSGQILNIKYPEETQQVTNTNGFTPILYDVIVNEVTDSGRIQTIYYNCQIMDGFGGIADYCEYTLRPNTQLQPSDNGNPSTSGSDLISTVVDDRKDMDFTKLQGAQVLLLCLDGTPQHAYIIGGVKNYQSTLNDSGNDSPDAQGAKFLNPYAAPTKNDGYYLKWSFNGMYFFVNKDGEMLIQRYGPTNSDGSSVQTDDNGKGVSLQFDKNGNINIGNKIKDGTAANTVVLNIDGSIVVNTDVSGDNNLLTINKDCSLTIAVKGGKTITIENKDDDAKMTLGSGSKSAAVAEELQQLYNQLKQKLDVFDNHTHSTGVGPSGPPTPTITAPSWADAIVSKSLKIPK